MASNIRVVLEVDNKKYLNDIRAADRATEQFATNTARNTGKVDVALNALGRQFFKLRTAIAGLAIGALGRSLLQLADEIIDLSNATGIAAGRIIELRDAIQAAGGAPGDATTALTRFAQAVDDAAGGSISAQNRFIDLGVSLDNLRNLSDEALFMKTLEELAKMEAGAKRTALMVEYFGKSFRTVDPKQLLAELKATRGEGDAYAQSVKKASDLQGQLEKSFNNLRMSLLLGFGPVIEQLTEFTSKLVISKEQVQQVVDVVKGLAAALVGLGAIAGLLLVVRYVGVLGRGIGAAIKLFEAFSAPATAAAAATGRAAAQAATLGTRISGLFAAFAPVLTAARALSVIVGTGFGIYAATQLFDNFGDIATNAIARVVESLGVLIGTIASASAGGAFGAGLGSIFGPAGSIVGGITGSIAGALAGGAAFDKLGEKARQAREEAERLRRSEIWGQKIGGGRGGVEGMPQAQPGEGVAVATGKGVLGTTTAASPGRDVDTTARQNAINQLKQIGVELANNLEKRRKEIDLETNLIGESANFIELKKAEIAVNQEITAAIDQLIKKKQELGKDEKYLIPTINEQIKLLEGRRKTELAGLEASILIKQARQEYYMMELQNGKQLNDLENIRAQLLGYSLTELEKFNQQQRAGDFTDKTAKQIEQLKQQAIERDKLTQTLNTEVTARQTVSKLIELETSILGRQFTELEKLNQAKAASPEKFARMTEEENNALITQAKALDEAAAKYNALAFARDLSRQGEDFAAGIRDQLRLDEAAGESARRRIQVEIEGRNALTAKLREISDRYGDEMKLSEELRAKRQKEIDDATAGLAKLTAAKKKSVEEDQKIRDSFTFGWDTAFNKYAEDALNAATQAKTYFDTFTKGFEDAIVRFVQTGKLSFKDLANSLIAEFVRIQAKQLALSMFGGGGGGGLFGSLFSGIGSIFGFANGGNPAMNKPILVGERGPELMIPRNASTIVPNEMLGGGGQQTVVNYNIQAVDASSFRALVARDPEFIFAVTEQGRRQLPNRARR